MKNWQIYVIIVLLLLLAAFYLLHTETSNSAELKIEGLKADVKTLQSSETHYKLITDSLKKLIPTLKEKHIVNEAKADKPILKLKERIEENRPQVMHEIDSMAIVKAFVGDLDSLNLAQENKINVLKADHQEDLNVLNEIIESQDSAYSKQSKIVELITEENRILTNENHKLKKKIKARGFFGWCKTIGAAVGSFFVGRGAHI